MKKELWVGYKINQSKLNCISSQTIHLALFREESSTFSKFYYLRLFITEKILWLHTSLLLVLTKLFCFLDRVSARLFCFFNPFKISHNSSWVNTSQTNRDNKHFYLTLVFIPQYISNCSKRKIRRQFYNTL